MDHVNIKYKNLIENLPDAFAYHKIVTNSKGQPVDYIFLDVNKPFEIMTGLRKENIIGKKITKVLPDIKKGFDWISNYGKVAITRQTIEVEEYSVPLKKWYKVTAYSDQKGYFATIFSDITKKVNDEKNMEIIIKASEEFLQLPDKDIDYQKITDTMGKISGGKYVAFNLYEENGIEYKTVAMSGIGEDIKKASSILGSKVIGKKWKHDPVRAEKMSKSIITYFPSLQELTGNIIPKPIINLLEKTFNLGEVYIVKIEKDNKLFGDFTIFMPYGVKLENTNFINIYNKQVSLYIARKKAEEDLLASKKELEGFFDVALDLLCIADTDGNFLKVNKAWGDILGYPKDKLEKMKFLDFVHPDDMEPTINAINKLNEQENILNFVNRYRASDGSYKYIEWRSHPVGNLIYAAARDITAHIVSEEKIKKSLAEKDILLQEIHHRVKNNLQTVNSILNLQSSKIEDENTILQLNNAKNRIRAMSLVHEKLYGTKTFDKVEISQYLTELLDILIYSSTSLNENINLEVDLDETYIKLDQAIPLGLILNEIITNSIKHGLKNINNPKIQIKSKQAKGKINISVKDNGKGLPEGFDIEKSESLGWQLIPILINELDGEYQTINNNGLEVIISIPY